MMQTLATGNKPYARPALRGFTLLELLVVMVIIGIVTAMITITSPSNPSARLGEDAERLAQLLTLAYDEAELTGRAVVLEADLQGWRFLRLGATGWQPLPDDLFRPGRFATPLDGLELDGRQARANGSTGVLRIVIAREALDNAFVITLRRDGHDAQVVADGIGRYRASLISAVQQPAPVHTRAA